MSDASPGAAKSPLTSPEAAVRVARIVWAALLIGVVGFLALAVFLPRASTVEAPPPLLFWVSLGVSVVLLPASFLTREAIWGKARTAAGVAPYAWFTGGMAQQAMCEGASFLGSTVTLISASPWPAAIPALIGLVGLVLGRPATDELDATPPPR